MRLRYALTIGAALVCSTTALAQITIDADDTPFQFGTHTYTGLFTENESGAHTAALNALIERAGPDQLFDFTTVAFEERVEGDLTVHRGAEGPGASVDPLSRATHTAEFRIAFEEEGEEVEILELLYLALTDEEAVELGAYSEETFDGEAFTMTVRKLPDGDLTAVFPIAYGDTWSSNYDLEMDDGTPATYPVSQTYEVDAWGHLRLPGVDEDVPALRLKVTSHPVEGGATQTRIGYEYRTRAGLTAFIGQGTGAAPPFAEIAMVGVRGTSTEDGSTPVALGLEPAYPNPFQTEATVAFTIPQAEHVRVAVYDLLGREVARLADGPLPAGRHALRLDGRALQAGLYLVRVNAGTASWTRKVTRLR